MANAGIAKLSPVRQQQAPLRNKIISALRDAIESGVLEPGARLVEKELCEQLDVSRTSLREALRELQAEGMLEQTSTRSLTVSNLSPADAANAYQIRAVLEALVVGQFIALASDGEFKLLAKDGETLKAAYRSGALDRMIGAKRNFYRRLCAGADNRVAFDIINRLMLRTSNLRSRSMLRKERQLQGAEEIDALLTAIAARDVAAARQAVTVHVDQAAAFALGGEDEPSPVIPAEAGTQV
jgi:DNA-binding GntR family transcriptional regulator